MCQVGGGLSLTPVVRMAELYQRLHGHARRLVLPGERGHRAIHLFPEFCETSAVSLVLDLGIAPGIFLRRSGFTAPRRVRLVHQAQVRLCHRQCRGQAGALLFAAATFGGAAVRGGSPPLKAGQLRARRHQVRRGSRVVPLRGAPPRAACLSAFAPAQGPRAAGGPPAGAGCAGRRGGLLGLVRVLLWTSARPRHGGVPQRKVGIFLLYRYFTRNSTFCITQKGSYPPLPWLAAPVLAGPSPPSERRCGQPRPSPRAASCSAKDGLRVLQRRPRRTARRGGRAGPRGAGLLTRPEASPAQHGHLEELRSLTPPRGASH